MAPETIYPAAMSHLAALSIAVLLSACVVADERDAGVSTQRQALEGSCDEFLCGANGPLIGGLPFWELDTQPNAAAAMSITQVTDPHGVIGKLVVTGAQVAFVAAGHPAIGGLRLVGTQIAITAAPATPTARPRTFIVTIVEYHPVAYQPGASGPAIESYRLAWTETTPMAVSALVTSSALTNVCSSLETEEDGLVSGNAILYGGERFAPATGAITASDAAAGTWINIACAGDLRAKLVRIGYYPATKHTTLDDRQAAVWMFSARYCGTTPYTHSGVKLAWRLRGDASPLQTGQTREAIWTAKGAACLSDTPRAFARKAVACASELPPCTDEMFGEGWQSYGILASALPAEE